MEKKWIEFAELFGDAFIELLEDEHTITITLAKGKVERVKNLLKKPLPEDDDIYVIDACCNSCGDSDYHYNKCVASLENGRCKIVSQWQETKNSTKTQRRTKHRTAVVVLDVSAFTKERYDPIIWQGWVKPHFLTKQKQGQNWKN